MTNNGYTKGVCPPRNRLEKLVTGKPESPLPASLREHIEHCEVCTGLLDGLTLDDRLASTLSGSWAAGTGSSGFLPPLPPRVIPGYVLESRINEGAQGVVYRAAPADQGGIHVAIKVCRPCDQKARHRFEREAAILGQIRHSAIPKVYGYGVIEHFDQEMPYLVMDFVSGMAVTEHAASRRFGTREIVGLIALCCEPLQSAHAHGIVHRDLKPANILVRDDGSLVLIDFGIAHCDAGCEDTTYLTSARQVLGTLAYMSPEQLRGDHSHIGPWSDVYSLGVVLYEMLTGRHPFESVRRKPLSLLKAMESSSVPMLSDAAPGQRFPRTLEQVVSRAMHPEPDSRYDNASQLRAALVTVIENQGKKITLTRSRSRVSRRESLSRLWRHAAPFMVGFGCGAGFMTAWVLL